MGLFDKKYCDICSEKIGLLGNRKLEDGNMCNHCAKKLSPFTTDRRRTTLDDIKAHLTYREMNKPKVERFNVTRQFGGNTKVLLDDNNSTFIVTSTNRWQSENPDVIDIAQVAGCHLDIRESRAEIKMTNREGKWVSYNPPRYDLYYDFHMIITINSPYFSVIEFKLNTNRVDCRNLIKHREYERQTLEIQNALSPRRPAAQSPSKQSVYAVPPPVPPAPSAPTGPRSCAHCGAPAATNSAKFCESCGAAMQR
ncbi:MAG: DUF4428 domain-containing protein [Peptococcaceae bacterium]|nr:DUF4428 domain-containing protein [Peptococcaceae bacterium]